MFIRKFIIGLALAVPVLGNTSADAADIRVSNASQLLQAFSKVNRGDTITVSSGVNLGKLNIDGKRYPRLATSGSQFITIRSLSANDPAYFQQLGVQNVKYFRMSALGFDSVLDMKEAFLIENSQNVDFVNCVTQGQRIGGDGTGNGLFFNGIRNLTVRDSDFLDLHTSLTVKNSSDILVSGNQLLRGSYDTIHLGTVNAIMIENNVIRAEPTSKVKHVDYMQFTNMGSADASANITVRNNDFRSLNDISVHGVYFGNYDAQNGSANDKSEHYRDILIQGNYIESSHMAAIAVSYADGVEIRDNVVKRSPNSGRSTSTISMPTILVETSNTDVAITGNTTVTAPRSGHLMDSWRSIPIPKSWDVRNNNVVK